ncbi:heterokaryon incompatibility protein-domain-containing protein [Podospora conica]|nr:heterokaryon incompatibility protein-domain-containing protein [Schizothecium conicum]
MALDPDSEFYFLDTSHPPKLRSALVIFADQIWTMTLMTTFISAPGSSLTTEVLRLPLQFVFPRHLYVPEAIAMCSYLVLTWRDRPDLLWRSFQSNEDFANHARIHPKVREVLWFAATIPTYLYATFLIRNHPWLFWNIFWRIFTPVLPRLAALFALLIATNTWAFFAGEYQARRGQWHMGILLGRAGTLLERVLKVCCRAPRPLMYLLFAAFDLAQDGVELCRRLLARATILAPRPPRTLQRYKHSPLSDAKSQIRLLRIASRGLQGIRCTLIGVPLDTWKSYEAISWTWDTPAEQGTNTLLIDGMEFGISPNMYRILSALTPIRGTRLVWIDTICIDQTNSTEKQDQLPLMTKIYASAERVIAFPGDGPLANLATDFLGDLELHLAARFTPQIFPRMDRSDHFPYSDRKKAWTAFFQLVQLRFWTRAWIIQELVVAKAVVIRHGRSEIPFDIFGRIVMAFKAPINGVMALSVDDTLVYSGNYEAGRSGLDFIGRLCFLRQMYDLDPNAPRRPMRGLQLDEMPDFPDLLVECVQSEATMPHDKVWAICGIVRDPHWDLARLHPNYALDGIKIYTDTAQYVLRNGGARQFALLGIAGCNKPPDPSSPSWVPDLAQIPQLYPIDNGMCPYFAGGPSDPDGCPVAFSTDGTQLRLKAYFVDTVHRVDASNPHVLIRGRSLQFPSTEARMADLRTWLGNIHRLTTSTDPDPDTGINLPTAVLRALILDNDNTTVPASQETIDDLSLFISVITADDPETVTLATTRWEDLSDEEIRLRSQRGGQLMSRATSGRQFAVSRRGRPMIVPGQAQEGDEVVVFEGGRESINPRISSPSSTITHILTLIVHHTQSHQDIDADTPPPQLPNMPSTETPTLTGRTVTETIKAKKIKTKTNRVKIKNINTKTRMPIW